MLNCPKCNYKAKTPLRLGSHLWHVHHIAGKSSNSKAKKEKKLKRKYTKRKISVSLNEAIATLELEMHSMQGVITHLRSML